MRLFEYQAKERFAATGIPIPRGEVVRGANLGDAVREAAERLLADAPAVMVKSQLLVGGRGKAGLIKRATTAADAAAYARELAEGPYAVRTVLVEEAVDIERELYLSISPDPGDARLVVLASREGGVEIEELAKNRPEAIRKLFIDLERGLQPYQARGLAYELGLVGDTVKRFSAVLSALYRVFTDHDAELVEINPLFLTTGGSPAPGGAQTSGGTPATGGTLTAGDGKMSIDDNSLFRQPSFERSRDQYDSDAEFDAAVEGIPYIQFDGDISLMCAGAGLTTTVFDLVVDEGGSVANYLEFGGPNYTRAQRAMELCLKNDSAVILIVTFGTIARADVMARGVVDAIAELKPNRPIVTCIRGTNEDAAFETLRSAGLEPLSDTEEAVRRAVSIAAARRCWKEHADRTDVGAGVGSAVGAAAGEYDGAAASPEQRVGDHAVTSPMTEAAEGDHR